MESVDVPVVCAADPIVEKIQEECCCSAEVAFPIPVEAQQFGCGPCTAKFAGGRSRSPSRSRSRSRSRGKSGKRTGLHHYRVHSPVVQHATKKRKTHRKKKAASTVAKRGGRKASTASKKKKAASGHKRHW